MNIAKFSIKHQPVIWLVLVLVLALGTLNYFTISQRENPQFKISLALVVTIWPGASAEKTERLVTKRLEDKFEEISSIKEIKSTTREMLSVIMVRANYDEEMEPVWQKVRNKILEVKDELPTNIIGPDVIDDFGDVTAMIYSFSSDTASPAELKEWADNLRDQIKTLKSVGKIELLGEHEEAIYIEGPLESFSLYNFAPLRSAKFLDYQNVNMPAGYVRTPTRNYRLGVSGSFKLTEQLEEAILDVSKQSGTPLRVKDVFNVRRAYKEPQLDVMKTNGRISVGLDIRMRRGDNLVVMGEEVKAVVAGFMENLPGNITLDLIHDQPKQVESFVGDFMNNLFQGLFIVVVVMFLAMGVRAAGMIALSLPLSIIITFAFMPLFHVDLETISIAAFIIALGMLVDNAIIITDNIDVHMRKGENALTASYKGAEELFWPALYGTLATVVAFMPLVLLGDEQGDFIRSLPIVVSVSLIISLVLAMTVTPIASSLFLKPKAVINKDGRVKDNVFVRGYRRLITWSLAHIKTIIAITTIAFLGAVALLPVVGFSFFPEAERDQFMIDVWLPEGSSLEHTENIADQIGRQLDKEELVKNYVSYIGKGGPRFYMSIVPEFNSSNYAQFVVTTKDKEATRAFADRLDTQLQKTISGARVLVSNLWMGVPVEAPIAYRITGSDLYEMKDLSLKIQNILRSVKGTIQVRDNVGEVIPSLSINIDSEAAAMAGISNTEVAVALLTAYEGFPVTSFREGETEIPVYIRLIESERNMGNTLDSILVPSSITGAKVPLSSFAKIGTTWGPGVIKRINGQRSITALAGVRDRLASDVLKEVKPLIAKIDLPKGYTIKNFGEEKERNESFAEMGMIFGLIIAMILLMLVIQFNSFKMALVILSSIPLAIIGAILGLLASGNSFAFMPFLGVISLAGMVIKNAVVWVEFVEKSVREGNSLRQAIIDAGQQRLRPIILTAATTIGGLIPLALFGGKLWEGMAYAMIFGLALATVLTLLVVPVIFFSAFRKEYNKKLSNKVA